MAHSHSGARDRFSTRRARRRRNTARSAGFFAALLSFLQLASPGRAQAASVEESGIDLLTVHRTNYFVTGFTDDTQVKFQFSIKYDLWPNRTATTSTLRTRRSRCGTCIRGARLSREQLQPTGLLQPPHGGRSRPSRVLARRRADRLRPRIEWRGRQPIRSLNRVCAAGSAACVDSRGRFIGWGVQVWLPFGLRDNDDITDYAGFGEFHLRAGVMDSERGWGSGELMLAGRKGTNTHGSLLAELTWRLGYRGAFGRAVRFAPFLFVQLFTGQGETLLRYDQTDRSVRVGIALRDRALLHE